MQFAWTVTVSTTPAPQAPSTLCRLQVCKANWFRRGRDPVWFLREISANNFKAIKRLGSRKFTVSAGHRRLLAPAVNSITCHCKYELIYIGMTLIMCTDPITVELKIYKHRLLMKVVTDVGLSFLACIQTKILYYIN